MGIGELIPNINVTESSKLDRRSIRFLKSFFPDDQVDSDQLQEGGNLPNIDGYLDILCPDGTAKEKIVVQVKHLTYSEKNGDVYYDIPQSIYAYAERHKGELVVFIACDDAANKFYWRYIDVESIEEFKSKSNHIQNTARYHFQEIEQCSEINVRDTIDLWRELYNKKMDSIKDEKVLAEQFALQQRMCFNSIASELSGVKNSHIIRYQGDEIVQWIKKDQDDKKRICLLVGDAGVGKSAVMKDLISSYNNGNIKYLCIKADYIDDNGNPVTLEKIRETLAYYSVEADKVILIVDQIDALSQALTNDRKHLNMMMAILFSLEDWPNVKAVVSCRKYDLEYDSVLNSLKEKSTIVEIGELTDEEVVFALNNMEEGLGKKVDSVTLKVLKTVQMLDSFSVLFHRNKTKISFNNQIELYDALWDNVICDSSLQNDVKERESLMYQIAETIRMTGTLNPQFAPISSQKLAFEYLASNGLIRRAGRAISFFHQSFYEYTIARYYAENDSLFANDIKKEIQGLELRSMVKAVLDFKRGHDITKFVEEARSILIGPNIRLHIKLLALSVLAFVDEPSRGEKNLIAEICCADQQLLSYFLRGVNSARWFTTIRKILNGIIPELKRNDNIFFPIIPCLSRYAFSNPEGVYGMVNKIKDQESRLFAVAYILREHNNYNNPYVLKAYAEAKPKNTFFAINLIQDALTTYKDFALQEAEKLILDYLISKDTRSKHDGHELVEELCHKLCADYPAEMLGILYRCICETVRRTAINGYYGYTISTTFNGLPTDDYVLKLVNLFETLLRHYSSDIVLARPLVEELLSLNNETTLSMAFTAMASAPRLYDDLIRHQLADFKSIGKCLHGDVEYCFLTMLRSWYDTLDINAAEWYQRLLFSYKSENDFIYDSTRKWSSFLCPHLWWDKWILICNTLPEDSLIPEMKKCSQELMRRFGRRITTERRDHSVTMACYCGGVVSDAIYEKWSISNWLSSFLKFDEHKWRYARNPISLHEHADAFQKCVSSNPMKFYNLVLNISSRTDIPDVYKIAGLKGLLTGGVDPYFLWNLATKYINENYARNNSYSFSQIAEYYIKEENKYIDEIMELCKSLAISSFSMDHSVLMDNDGDRDLHRQVNDLFTMGINSFQGRAAELLVHMCAIKSRRSMIYAFFTDNSTLLHNCVKIVPLHYMNVKDYYEEELYFPMMNSLLSNMGSEALYIQANTIQWCFYHRHDVVINYIDNVESDTSSHSLLAQIYFYGMAGPNNPEECEKRLERILALDNEEVIAKLVEVALKSYEHTEYRDLSIKLLERYASDEREKVKEAYCWYCDYLPVDAFNWYCSISFDGVGKKRREIHDQLKYVKKCISIYPIQCYKFIASQRYFDVDDSWMYNDEIVKILLEIYNKLKLDEDIDAMNELLDLFDEYIYRDNRTINDAVLLLG